MKHREKHTTLAQLDAKAKLQIITVRVFKVWEAKNPQTGDDYGLESIFIDTEGTGIEATIENIFADAVRPMLPEGSVVQIKDFNIARRRVKYCTVNHRYHLKISNSTEILPKPEITNIPTMYFEFVPIDRITSETVDGKHMIDIIGQIKSVKLPRDTPSEQSSTQVRDIQVADERGYEIRVSIWSSEQHQLDINMITEQSQTNPIIAAFSSVAIKKFREKWHLSTYSGTRIYLDDVIPDYNEIKSRYSTIQIRNEPIQMIARPAQEAIQEMSIKQLLAAYKLGQNIEYRCTATIDHIDVGSGWYYDTCGEHSVKLKKKGNTFLCEYCKVPVTKIVPWYKITATVSDNDEDEADFVILGNNAKFLLGISAKALQLEHDPQQHGKLPQRIKALEDETFVFNVMRTNITETIGTAAFTVTRVERLKTINTEALPLPNVEHSITDTTDTTASSKTTQSSTTEPPPNPKTPSKKTSTKRTVDSYATPGKDKIEDTDTATMEPPTKRQASKKLVIRSNKENA